MTETPTRARRAWAPEVGEETAMAARALMANPWLVPGRHDQTIKRVRRNSDALRDVFNRLGWTLVVERDVVRLRKTPPPRPAAWAADAPEPATCSWFFLVVAAAEGLPPKVTISALVTAARAAAAEAGLTVTGQISERRAIAAALKLADERGVIERMDGDIDDFVHDETAPVLLAVHHTRLLQVIANPGTGDPAADIAAWLTGVRREPDPARRMRRRLVDDSLVHSGDLDEDEADWLRRRLRGDDGAPLAQAFGLHIERRAEGAAFVVPDEAFRYPYELGPRVFPAPGTVGHATILLVDTAALEGAPDPTRPGWATLSGPVVLDHLSRWATDIGPGRGGWAAEDVADPPRLAAKVANLLVALDLVRLDDVDPTRATWSFSPATGRWEAPPNSAYGRHHQEDR